MQTRKFTECLTASLMALLLAASLHAQGPLQVYWSFDRASRTPSMSYLAKTTLEDALQIFHVDSVLVEGWTSPDGSYPTNLLLSAERAERVAGILKEMLPEGAPVLAIGCGERWDAVADFVAASDNPTVAASRKQLLSIMERESDPDRREWILRDRFPASWNVVRGACYGAARTARATLWLSSKEEGSSTPSFTDSTPVVISVQPEPVDFVIEVDTAARQKAETFPSLKEEDVDGRQAEEVTPLIVSEPVAESYDRLWRTAFRTNLLAPALNVGFEVGLGRNRRFVLATEFWYPWLRPFIHDAGTCLEGIGWSLEGTFYLLRQTDPHRWASGPYVGLSGAAGYYDVCFNASGRQGEGAAASLYIGWSFPVNRGRWRLSLDIGGGYMITKYREYYVWEDGSSYRPGDWQAVFSWWGPTRASFALHIPIWYDARR